MPNKEPKTQGKIIERFRKEFNSPEDTYWMNADGEHSTNTVFPRDIERFILKEQNNLIERVLEIVGEDEKESVFCSEDLYSARNNLRKEFRTKISQMSEEL